MIQGLPPGVGGCTSLLVEAPHTPYWFALILGAPPVGLGLKLPGIDGKVQVLPVLLVTPAFPSSVNQVSLVFDIPANPTLSNISVGVQGLVLASPQGGGELTNRSRSPCSSSPSGTPSQSSIPETPRDP